MRLGLRLFPPFFPIVGLAAFFVVRVFVDEVKPGVRQAMESTLVDTANVLAVMAAADLKAGRIGEGGFARHLEQASRRDPAARIWDVPKHGIDLRVTVTDARGIVVFDSRGQDLGRDNSRWAEVYRTLRGEYGARSSPESPGDASATVMHVAAPVSEPDDPWRPRGVVTVARHARRLGPVRGRARAAAAIPPRRDRRPRPGAGGDAPPAGGQGLRGAVRAVADPRDEEPAGGDPRRGRTAAGAAAGSRPPALRPQHPRAAGASYRDHRQAAGPGRSGAARLAAKARAGGAGHPAGGGGRGRRTGPGQ